MNSKENRYRCTIMVDIWEEKQEDAEKQLLEIIRTIPNSFSVEISKTENV